MTYSKSQASTSMINLWTPKQILNLNRKMLLWTTENTYREQNVQFYSQTATMQPGTSSTEVFHQQTMGPKKYFSQSALSFMLLLKKSFIHQYYFHKVLHFFNRLHSVWIRCKAEIQSSPTSLLSKHISQQLQSSDFFLLLFYFFNTFSLSIHPLPPGTTMYSVLGAFQ